MRDSGCFYLEDGSSGCFSWSLAPLLSGGCDGLTEPSLFSPIPCGAPNSMRVSSSIPTNVGLTSTSRVSSTKTLLLMPRVLNGVMPSSMLLSILSEVHAIASVQLPSAPLVFGVLDPVIGLLVPPCGLWFTQALCLRHCPSRFQPYACAATCVYDHGSLIPDDSALVWFSVDASSQVQSGLGISRMFLDAHISQVASAAASTASFNVQEVQAVAAFRAGVRAFVSCFTLVGLFVRAWMFCVAISFWTEFEFHFLFVTKGFGYKEDKQIRKVEGLAGMFLISFLPSGSVAALSAAAFLIFEGFAAAASRCAFMFLMCFVGVIRCGILEGTAKDASEFPYVLIIGFFANEWRWFAAAAAARYAFSCGCAAAGALQCIFTLEERHSVLVDLEHFNEPYGEVGHNTGSGLTEGIGEQASGRVDVPGGVQPVAALHERLGHSWGQEKNFLHQDENCKFPVFLRSLDGSTKVLHVHGYEKVSQVKQRISESMLNSKLLDEDALLIESGISRDMHIAVCGRLRGGATYGECVCSFCKRGGCWASKPFCFRCGQPRQNIPAGTGFPPNGYKGNFREQ